MGIQSKLHVIKSLDSLLYYHFVYIYFLDASLLLLIFRVFLQLPLLSSRALPRTLRTATGVVTAELGICILIHGLSEPGQPGILIDFVGNVTHASILRLIWLDLMIYGLQMIRIFMTFNLSLQNDLVATTVPVPPALVPALGAETLTLMLPSSNSSRNREEQQDDRDPFYRTDDMVMEIELKSSLQSIMQPTPQEQDPVDRLPV
ncbi:hypothetical protein O0I10_010280 [Lichtheimia ornata]|uniref:DUF1746 domain-containing protein n=1 Tax=Lichtheimia ornata TaxID=688661 RepID=A0AAD7UV03_9FUNG|nr:uncharacterized protein O0I10_010280 [Lichtheimia ornata]KAJ8654069.1 hypothetical protein O0I10_010280 [Lichtheimia ornata]